MKYFVTYAWRWSTYAPGEWDYANVIIDEHPFTWWKKWLMEEAEHNLKNSPREKSRLLWWIEIRDHHAEIAGDMFK